MILSSSDEIQAAIDTARATQWLVVATAVLATSNIGVVFVALIVPLLERNARRREQQASNGRSNRAARAAIIEALDLMHEIDALLEPQVELDTVELWRLLNVRNIRKLVLERHFNGPLDDARLPAQLATTIQGLHETRSAVFGLQPGEPHAKNGAAGRAAAAGTMKRALERVAKVEAAIRSEHGTGSKAT